MKRRLVILGVNVVLVFVFLWLRYRPPLQSSETHPHSALGTTSVNTEALVNTQSSEAASQTAVASVNLVEQRQARSISSVEESRQMWNTPIEFYGKVVDEKGNPVADANIQFVCNDLSEAGATFYNLKSDEHGMFSLTGVRGKGISVHVSKDGYYTSKRDRRNFEYAGANENFIPNSSNPVVFHLHKKGPQEKLLATAGRIKIPLNGTPRGFDFETGKPVSIAQAQVILECQADYKNRKPEERFDWVLRIHCVNGGVVESTNEFDFEAPEDGYNTVYEIRMACDTGKDWTNMISRKCFLKLANGRYAKLAFSFIAYNGVFRFRSFVNPSGGRNLEHEPDFQPNTTVLE